jgi:DNA-binding HxlR family transcriptional regulator
MGARQAKTPGAAALKEAMVREMLERVGDKWTLLVIEELGSGGEMRFTQLRTTAPSRRSTISPARWASFVGERELRTSAMHTSRS